MAQRIARVRMLIGSVLAGGAVAVMHPVLVATFTGDVTSDRASQRGQYVEPYRARIVQARHEGRLYLIETTQIIDHVFDAPGATTYQWTLAAPTSPRTGDAGSRAWSAPIDELVTHQSELDALEGVTLGYGWPYVSLAVDNGATSFREFTPLNGIPLADTDPVGTDAGAVHRAIPTRIIWPGLIINTVLLSACSFLITLAGGHIVRERTNRQSSTRAARRRNARDAGDAATQSRANT